MPLSTGTRIGPYEVESKLGAGGMGEVYKARDTRLSRHVAIKVLPDLVATDPERVARFEREAQVLAALSHPHIGAIYGLEVADGGKSRYLILEFIDGESLAGSARERARCRSTKPSRTPGRCSTPSKPRTRRASSIAI